MSTDLPSTEHTGRSGAFRSSGFASAIWVWLIVICGFFGSTLLGWQQRQIEQSRHEENFISAAKEVRKDLEQQLARCDRLLESATIWAEGARREDVEAWRSMAQRLHVGEHD